MVGKAALLPALLFATSSCSSSATAEGSSSDSSSAISSDVAAGFDGALCDLDDVFTADLRLPVAAPPRLLRGLGAGST